LRAGGQGGPKDLPVLRLGRTPVFGGLDAQAAHQTFSKVSNRQGRHEPAPMMLLLAAMTAMPLTAAMTAYTRIEMALDALSILRPRQFTVSGRDFGDNALNGRRKARP
jgi:hypothetical protein